MSFRKSLWSIQKHEKTRIIFYNTDKNQSLQIWTATSYWTTTFSRFWFRQLFLTWTTCVQSVFLLFFLFWLVKNQVHSRNISIIQLSSLFFLLFLFLFSLFLFSPSFLFPFPFSFSSASLGNSFSYEMNFYSYIMNAKPHFFKWFYISHSCCWLSSSSACKKFKGNYSHMKKWVQSKCERLL